MQAHISKPCDEVKVFDAISGIDEWYIVADVRAEGQRIRPLGMNFYISTSLIKEVRVNEEN